MRNHVAWTLVLMLLALPATGCQSSNQGSWVGAGVGAAGGALIGGIIGHQSGNKWEGAAIGAAAGALAGYIVGTELGTQGDTSHLNSVEHKKAQAAFDLGNRTEDPRAAISQFEQAAALDPMHPEPYNNAGLCYLKLNDRAMAKAQFQKALNVDPAFQPAKDNLDRVNRGQ